MPVQVQSAYKIKISPKEIQKFYENFWKRKIALSVDEFYQWQFIQTPGTNGMDHCCVAIDERQNIVGVMGVTPRPFHLNGQKITGAELTTWLVHPDYQSKGAGAYILEFLQQQYDMLIGMGITDMAIPLYCRSGFRYLKGIPRYIKVLNWENIRSFAKMTPLAIKIDRYWNKINKIHPYNVSAVDDDIIQALHQEMLSFLITLAVMLPMSNGDMLSILLFLMKALLSLLKMIH